jgi:hypothetical protein
MFDEAMGLVAGRLGLVEPRGTARQFVLGLLSGVERKNCWWLAERVVCWGAGRVAARKRQQEQT